MDQPRVVFCNCSNAEVVPDEVKKGVLCALSESNLPFDAVPDLCELAATKHPAIAEMASSDDLRIMACYPRAVKSLFAAAGHKLADDCVRVLNMREHSANEILTGLVSCCCNPKEGNKDE